MRIDPQLSATSLEAQRARIAARTDANAAGAADVSGTTRQDSTDRARRTQVAPTVAASEPATVGSPSVEIEITVDDILKNWGTNNTEADLNGDGGVDAADLALLLSWQGGEDPIDVPDLGAGDTPDLSTGTEGDAPQFTLEELMKNWGQSDSDYDFDGDGTVGAADLAQFLSGQIDAPTGPPAFAPPTGDGDRVAQLLSEWGSADSNYDLNSDGTVDAADLAALLATQNNPLIEPTSTGAAERTNGAASANDWIAGLSKEILSRVGGEDGVISQKEFPGNDAIFKIVDQDADGVITGRDLQSAINHSLNSVMKVTGDADLSAVASNWREAFGITDTLRPSGPEDQAGDLGRPLPRDPGDLGRPLPRDPGDLDTGRLDRLVGAIERRLERAGFGTQPPANLHDLLNTLDLSGDQQQYILRHLGETYPNGLGVNQTA